MIVHNDCCSVGSERFRALEKRVLDAGEGLLESMGRIQGESHQVLLLGLKSTNKIHWPGLCSECGEFLGKEHSGFF